jgi:tRNA(Ile)-lysidine synthase
VIFDPAALRIRVEEHIRRNRLIQAGGAVTCLVSGGPDSTCLWHGLRALGYQVAALHVNHKLRGDESENDARFCVEALGAQVVDAPGAGLSEAELRALRYSLAIDRLRATGHTASDQVETILYRLASSGAVTGIQVARADGVVRPLLVVWREETEHYCRAEGVAFRVDSSNPATKRGLIRERVLPLLRELHPAAERNILAALQQPELPRPVARAVAELLAATDGSKRIDLGGGTVAVREYDRIWLEAAPRRLDHPVQWGPWTIQPVMRGLVVRGWRPGDRLAGARSKKVQDVFVDAKIPRSEREAWPLVVRGDEVVVVPGLITAAGYEEAVVATRYEP